MIDSRDGHRYIGKIYQGPTADGRDRLEVELKALHFLRDNGFDCVPVPVKWDMINSVALMEYIKGKDTAPDIFDSDLDAMVDFLVRLKHLADQTETSLFPPASESWFCAADAVRNINGRISLLNSVEEQGALFSDLHRFIKMKLVPEYEDAHERIRRQLSKGQFSKKIPRKKWTLSPSDFGFNNTIKKEDGKLVFVDFEYFGWDDPAKMMADFLLHPGMQMRESHKRNFAESLLIGFESDKDLYTRLELLYPLCGLKWCTILLNEFRSDLLRHRNFADGHRFSREDRLARQLVKADEMLNHVKETHVQFPYKNNRRRQTKAG